MAKSRGGIPITPARMVAQWKDASHKFDLNVWNFQVEAGKAAVSTFQKSFDMRRFNTNGSSPWKPRKDRKSHPLLEETGTLKRSIKRKSLPGKNKGVRIFTDPKAFGNAKRHKGFCYAGIHNDGLKSINIAQRRFMGHSTRLDDELNKLSVSIFKGFPK